MTGKYLYAQFTAEEGQGDAVAALLRGYGDDVAAEAGNVRFDALGVAGVTAKTGDFACCSC